MKSVTQQLIERDISSGRESRRGVVSTEPRVLNYNTAGINTTVTVVDVNIGASHVLREVIVQSTSGKGGRSYAQQGKAVDLQRNAGGRWICVGPSDRIKTLGCVQTLDEATDLSVSSPDEGFAFGRRAYDFYSVNSVYGIKGYGNTVVLDAQGNEVL